VSFAAIILLCCFSTRVYYCCLFRYRLSPETFGYTLSFGGVSFSDLIALQGLVTIASKFQNILKDITDAKF
jgi:hypothetical protein